MDDYISKLVDMGKLRDVIERVMTRKGLNEQRRS